ncbi:hypothetical protein CBL_20788 [Carabus blaptoides fortunei]
MHGRQAWTEVSKRNLEENTALNVARKFLPSFKADNLLKRGDYQWYTSDSGLTAIKWKDKRTVHLLSNFHDPEVSTQVNRREKYGNIHPVACPQLLVDYNNNMNCVDNFDQLLASYKVNRRSKKWCHRIFFYFLDASVINAYCIYKELGIPKIKSKDFRRSIINGLFSETLVNKPKPPRTPLIEISNYKPFVPSEVRLESSKHQPVRAPPAALTISPTYIYPRLGNPSNYLIDPPIGSIALVTPEQIRPFPKAIPRSNVKTNKQTGKSRIYRSTPENDRLETLEKAKLRKQELKE